MMLRQTVVLFFLLVYTSTAFSQKYEEVNWTKQDEYQFQLQNSRSVRTAAIISATGGSALTILGISLMGKEGPAGTMVGSTLVFGPSDEPKRVYGTIITYLGVGTAIAAIPLFVKAAKIRKQANLFLSDQSTTFLNRKVVVPSIGVEIRL